MQKRHKFFPVYGIGLRVQVKAGFYIRSVRFNVCILKFGQLIAEYIT